MKKYDGPTINVLLDNSVRSYSIVAHGIRVSIPGHVNQLFLFQAKPPRSSSELWLRHQIEALPTIARLARENIVKLHTYAELLREAWNGPGGFPASPFGDVFRDVSIHEVRPAVQRSAFFAQPSEEYARTESFAKFCNWLLNDYDERWLDAPYVRSNLTPHEIDNLKNVQRYRNICKPLAAKHHTDAFHLWTGEISELTHFLTTDRKLINAAFRTTSYMPRCVPVLPTDLLAQLGVAKHDPLPFQYGARYTINGMRYD